MTGVGTGAGPKIASDSATQDFGWIDPATSNSTSKPQDLSLLTLKGVNSFPHWEFYQWALGPAHAVPGEHQ